MSDAQEAEPAGAAPQQQIAVRVSLDVNEDTASYYANYAEITHGMHDFGLAFARLPTKLSEAKLADANQNNVLTWDAAVQVVLPPSVIPGLIKALESQFAEFQKSVNANLDEAGK